MGSDKDGSKPSKKLEEECIVGTQEKLEKCQETWANTVENIACMQEIKKRRKQCTGCLNKCRRYEIRERFCRKWQGSGEVWPEGSLDYCEFETTTIFEWVKYEYSKPAHYYFGDYYFYDRERSYEATLGGRPQDTEEPRQRVDTEERLQRVYGIWV